MGAVYKAADQRLGGKTVAVKEMSDTGLPTAQQRQQAVNAFRQEAQMLAHLNHTNLPGFPTTSQKTASTTSLWSTSKGRRWRITSIAAVDQSARPKH